VKTRFDNIGYPLYCDAGPHEGDMRIDLAIRLYLSQQEYARYEGTESLHITLGAPGSQPLPAGGTAEPSRELQAGGMAAAGGPRLAAGPQPAPGEPLSDSSASTVKEYRDGCR
jgi:hypothetical protein